jgi:peptide/nickel transport system substrate-binding protein
MRWPVAVLVVAAAAGACLERGSGSRGEAAAAAPLGSATAKDGSNSPASATPAVPVAAIAHDRASERVRIHLEAEPAHLNPLLAGDVMATRIALGDVYEGLFCRGEGRAGQLRPCLADRVNVADEGRQWRFSLRPQATWHDGKPVTVADVVFTFGLLRAGAPTPLAAELDDLRRVESAGAGAVVLHFAQGRAGRLHSIAGVAILPRHAFAEVQPIALATAPASRAPIGTGPLRFVSWTQGEAVVLERFDRYWGQPARTRRVEYRMFTTRQRAIDALLAGELDVLVQVPIDEALAAARHPEVQLFAYEGNAYLAAVWNLRRRTLRPRAVRHALCLLLDRTGIIDQVFHGYAEPIAGPFADVAPVAGPPAPFARSRAAAADLLGQRAFAVELLVPSESRTMRRIADIWAADARPFAPLRVATAPFADVIARAERGQFDAVLLAFPTGEYVDHYSAFHSSQIGGHNFSGLADAETDQLLDQLRRARDPQDRRQLAARAQQRIAELAPYCFIASDRRVGLARVGVSGIAVTEDGLAARALQVVP